MKRPRTTPRNAFLAGAALPVIDALATAIVSVTSPETEPGTSLIPPLLLEPYFLISVLVFVLGIFDLPWRNLRVHYNPFLPSPEVLAVMGATFPRMLAWFLGAVCAAVLLSLLGLRP